MSFPDPNRPLECIIWQRAHDGALFAHLEQDSRPASHRFGPFKDAQEVHHFFHSNLVTADGPVNRLDKDCGPVEMPRVELRAANDAMPPAPKE